MLVKDEEKSKPKSLGAGLTYHSLLSSLLHSCPDLRPDSCPFHWLGSVFQSKRQKVELNREEPAYRVRYLGSAVTILAKGEGCVQEAVAKIWQHSNYGEQSLKLKLSVGPHGIRMGADASGRKKPSHLFSLSRITYCSAEAYRPKIFAWIYRHQVKNKAVVLRCHAVLLAKAEKARALALSLFQNASSSFSEFKRLKRQSDFRHCRQQLLGEGVVPVAPRRRLLNGQCHYQPPADKPSSATRLSSITEEEEEEDDEEDEEEQGGSDQEGEEDEEEVEEEDEGEKDREKEMGRRAIDRGPGQQLCERDVGKIISGLGECTISCTEDGQITISTLL